MIPSFIGIVVVCLGLLLVYVGVHGAGFLKVEPRAAFGGTGTAAVQ